MIYARRACWHHGRSWDRFTRYASSRMREAYDRLTTRLRLSCSPEKMSQHFKTCFKTTIVSHVVACRKLVACAKIAPCKSALTLLHYYNPVTQCVVHCKTTTINLKTERKNFGSTHKNKRPRIFIGLANANAKNVISPWKFLESDRHFALKSYKMQ